MLKRLFLTGADTQNAGLMTSAMVTQLNQLRQAVFGSGGSTAQSRSFYGLGIEINKGTGALHLRGAEELIAKGYTPYLFRYTRKRNRVNISGEKSHGPVRKGWNVLGKADTVTIGNDETVLIDAKVIHIAERQGKVLVPKKVRLLYGIAFSSAKPDNRKLLDKTTLVTPIIQFHVSTQINNGSYTWIFER